MRSLIGGFFILTGLLFPGFASALTLTSSAFANNGLIPDEYTYSSGECSGGNLSPPLTITGIPAGTLSLALIVLDPDGGDRLHWKAWNIPPATASLPENISATATFNQGNNDFGIAGYGGPCPPDSSHRYVFTLYALSTIFEEGEPSLAQLQGAALATATLSGERSAGDAASAAEIAAARLFAYGEANYPTLFKGSATSGQYLQYNYRYYPGSGNFLALDTAGVVYILGPFTNNKIEPFGPLESLLGSITGWEAVALPYTITIQNIGHCEEDGAGDFFEGVLTPTAQAGVYTTVFVGGEVINLNVPGDNAFRYSYADGNGTTDDSFQLDFAEQSRSISGSSDWTHSNDCYGSGTISGSW